MMRRLKVRNNLIVIMKLYVIGSCIGIMQAPKESNDDAEIVVFSESLQTLIDRNLFDVL